MFIRRPSHALAPLPQFRPASRVPGPPGQGTCCWPSCAAPPGTLGRSPPYHGLADVEVLLSKLDLRI